MSEEQKTTAAIDEATLLALEAGQEAPYFEQVERAEAEAQTLPPTKDLIMPICDLATKALCPNWDIQPQEVDALAEAYAAVIDKYFPDAASHLGVELNALLITAAIFVPRLASGEPPRKPREKQDPQPVQQQEEPQDERTEG